MSATDTIRAMLDERGVKWVDTGDGSTLIPAQAATDVAWDVNMWPSGKDMGDCLWVQNRHPLTPEQAIEATLGRGECQLKRANWDDGTCTWGCICSACDAHLEHETGIGYSFCPHCGAKVVGA